MYVISLRFIINTMYKSASNTLIILLLLILTQTIESKHLNILRSLPSKFQNAELVTTTKNLLLKLTSGEQVKLLNVPDVYQFYNYSSGHSCLQAIFSYYQFPNDANRYRETQFISDNDFDQNLFASPQKVVQAAKRKLSLQTLPQRQDVFDLKIQQNLSQRDIEALIQKGIPPILLITKNKNTEYGSYVVVVGHDRENYYFQDPFKLGSVAFLPKHELDTVWRSVIAYKQVSHLAITIQFKDHRNIQQVPLVRPSP